MNTQVPRAVRLVAMQLAMGLVVIGCTGIGKPADPVEHGPAIAAPSAPAPSVVEPPPSTPMTTEPVTTPTEPVTPTTPTPAPVAEAGEPARDDAAVEAALASLPRWEAPKRFPAQVFAAVADDARGVWSVDIVDWSLPDEHPAYDALITRDDVYVLPDDQAPLPEGWGVGDKWTLITRAGTVSQSVSRVALSASGGSGQLFVHTMLGALPKGAKGPALAVRGRLGKSPPKLVAPKPMRPSALGPDKLAEIHAALVAGFDEESRPLARASRLRDADVSIVPGRFPGGRTHVVVVRHAIHDDEGGTHISAMLFVRDDGTIEFFRQADVLGEMKLDGLVDLDADGLDEIFYEDAYHEGWYALLLHWKGTKPAVRVLTGDGL
jgi:hypothetical protein